MEDIICTVPEACGDRECPAQYHLAHYWLHGDETYSVCDSDGDHVPCDADDVPDADREVELWREYYAYVAETGADPVSQFVLPTSKKRKRRWQARVRNWIGSQTHGLRVIGVRRRGRGSWVSLEDAPVEVSDFLFLGHPEYQYGVKDWRGCKCCLGPEFKTFGDLTASAQNCNVKLRTVLGHADCTISFDVDESPATWGDARIAAWLKKKARFALRECNPHKNCTGQ